MNAIDAFAGPGGFDLALKELGIDPLGIEWDDAACATRAAAGLRTLQADVAKVDPASLGPCELFVGSPPCPTFSSAGNGAGNHLTEIIVRCLLDLAAGYDSRPERRQEAFEILQPVCWEAGCKAAKKKKREPDRQKAEERARRDADMSLLVVEPLRYILALEPRFIALEQVPGVLPLWSVMAEILGAIGYFTWTGVMEAERFGVPQTRERAILMADRDGEVSPPSPTHQRYMGRGHSKGDASLFDPGRRVHPDDVDLLPWISMAEGLGWEDGPEPAPAPTVTGGGTGSGGGIEVFAGEHARRRAQRAVVFRNGNRANAAERRPDEPAPTIHFGARSNKVDWVFERPSTAVCGDPRIFPPGYRGGKAEYAELGEGDDPARAGTDAIRVTEEEALILQSFPPDYPVQGSKSQRFLQIGNAVPVAMAIPILGELLRLNWAPLHAAYLATYARSPKKTYAQSSGSSRRLCRG